MAYSHPFVLLIINNRYFYKKGVSPLLYIIWPRIIYKYFFLRTYYVELYVLSTCVRSTYSLVCSVQAVGVQKIRIMSGKNNDNEYSLFFQKTR